MKIKWMDLGRFLMEPAKQAWKRSSTYFAK